MSNRVYDAKSEGDEQKHKRQTDKDPFGQGEIGGDVVEESAGRVGCHCDGNTRIFHQIKQKSIKGGEIQLLDAWGKGEWTKGPSDGEKKKRKIDQRPDEIEGETGLNVVSSSFRSIIFCELIKHIAIVPPHRVGRKGGSGRKECFLRFPRQDKNHEQEEYSGR